MEAPAKIYGARKGPEKENKRFKAGFLHNVIVTGTGNARAPCLDIKSRPFRLFLATFGQLHTFG